MKKLLLLFLVVVTVSLRAQEIKWATDGNSYYELESGEIVQHVLPANTKTTIVSKADLTPKDQTIPLAVRSYSFTPDQTKLLVFTNSVKVWRLNTRGDFWLLDLKSKSLKRLGIGRPASSLMFAKVSPDGTQAAYVSEWNLYLEDLASGKITALTTDGSRRYINGTFDWVYEEEYGCRDGFQWSPDNKHISYWNVDATKIRDYDMINITDSVYSRIIPVEYPTIGQNPSPTRIGIIDIETGKTNWIPVPGDPQQHYLTRLEWNTATELYVQQFNRKQNETKIWKYLPLTNVIAAIYTETDPAFIRLFNDFGDSRGGDFRHKLVWINDKKEFLWMSEKDGWTHLYRIGKDDGKETLITRGEFDVISVSGFNEKNNVVYFIASPTNATQRYLYKTTFDGKGKAELVSPAEQQGSHGYTFSPNCLYAQHSFSNTFTKRTTELISIASNKSLVEKDGIPAKLADATEAKSVEFFKVKTEEGIEMDGWMVKPKNFDPAKKYPVVFYVYTEPAGATVSDSYGTGKNRLYKGSMADDGYIYMSIDNRGTPAPKGRAWRKAIYRHMGLVNIRDQALGAKEILKFPFVDPDRIAVWGWSGGGTATLNLLFQFPDIYKTGISIASVANPLTYDNIYQERYYGLPQENLEEIMKGSPLTYAKNLRGNLLYIHGTGDDNVHYNNAEMLVNELVKFNKQFQFMAYPNRSHGINEGEGTTEHLSTLYTNFLKKNCPPGPR